MLPTLPNVTTTDHSDTTTAPTGEIVASDTWFSDDGYGSYDWGVVYDNTSSSTFQYVDVVASFLDDSGNEITTSETTISLAAPGPGAVTYYTYDLEDQAPASMEVTFTTHDTSDYDPGGTVTAGQLSVDEANSSAIGLLTSTAPTDLFDATVSGVWRDSAGAITLISSDYVDVIQANGDTWLSIYTGDTSLGVPAEVYVELSEPFSDPTPPSAELTLRESWNVDVGDGTLNWGAIVDNGGSTVWTGPTVLAKFFDADNRLVTADSAYTSELRPGANAVTGSVYGLPATPVRMEAVISDGGYVDDSPDPGTFTVDQVAITSDGSTATITGQITSTFAEEQSFVSLIMIWRDASNAVVYSTSAYTEEVPANGSVAFETSIYGESLPTTPPTEIYWSV